MGEPLNVLLIEDNKEHAYIITRHLRKAGGDGTIHLKHEEMLNKGLQRLSECRFDVILLDLRLPDSDIHETLPTTIRASQSIPIIVLSTLEDRELAVRMVHEGAQDYLVKGELSDELLIRAIYSAVERKRAEVMIRRQVHQKQALFDLGQYAISETKVSDLINKSLSLVARILELDLVGVMELMPGKDSLVMKAGIGWKEGSIGKVVVPANNFSLAGYTLLAGHPSVQGDLKSHSVIVVPDFAKEKRFQVMEHLKLHHVCSGMAVVIHGRDNSHPYGVLTSFTKTKKNFSEDDTSFMQAVANILAAAISRHQLEEELRSRIQELDMAHRRKDEFLATLSHELRTPLNIITGYVDLLKNARDVVEFDQALDAIERNVKIETQLVSDILDMAQIITGKMKLLVSSWSLRSVIDSAIESIQWAAQAKEIQIQTKLENEATLFVGDETKIQQAIWNLLMNSVKFTPEGGKIFIETRKRDSMMELSIRDTGQGIEPENLSHIFDKFWQEDSGFSRRHMGLGLGLAIVKQIVDLHGGAVRVFSEGRGKGTTFTICLPMISLSPKRDQMLSSQKKRDESTLSHPLPPLGPIRTLVIDDSLDSLKILDLLLKRLGAQVTTISSPQDGLLKAESGGFDLVISDIGMPELDGYQLMQKLRVWEKENHRDRTPAIALTAHVTENEIRKALDSGYQLHLAKPLNIGDLESAIRQLKLVGDLGRGVNSAQL